MDNLHYWLLTDREIIAGKSSHTVGGAVHI